MNRSTRRTLLSRLGTGRRHRRTATAFTGGLTPRRSPWLRLLRVVAVLVGLAVVIGTATALWLWDLYAASLPGLEGQRVVSGLSAPVRIERDRRGIPTLHAANRLDLAFATGFVHAQDRLFQMDLLRRAPAGELAELFG